MPACARPGLSPSPRPSPPGAAGGTSCSPSSARRPPRGWPEIDTREPEVPAAGAHGDAGQRTCLRGGQADTPLGDSEIRIPEWTRCTQVPPGGASFPSHDMDFPGDLERVPVICRGWGCPSALWRARPPGRCCRLGGTLPAARGSRWELCLLWFLVTLVLKCVLRLLVLQAPCRAGEGSSGRPTARLLASGLFREGKGPWDPPGTRQAEAT